MHDDSKHKLPESAPEGATPSELGLGSARQLLARLGRLAVQAREAAEGLVGRLLPDRPAGAPSAGADVASEPLPESESVPESFSEPEQTAEPERPSEPWVPGGARVVLLARDPEWLFCYWDIEPARRSAARPPGSRLSLRLQDVTDLEFNGANGWSQHLYPLTDEARWWHVPVPHLGRHYLAEVGFVSPEGTFRLLGRSESVATLCQEPAPDSEVELATIRLDEPLPGPNPDRATDNDVDRVSPRGSPLGGFAPSTQTDPGRPYVANGFAEDRRFTPPAPERIAPPSSWSVASHPGSSALWSRPR